MTTKFQHHRYLLDNVSLQSRRARWNSSITFYLTLTPPISGEDRSQSTSSLQGGFLQGVYPNKQSNTPQSPPAFPTAHLWTANTHSNKLTNKQKKHPVYTSVMMASKKSKSRVKAKAEYCGQSTIPYTQEWLHPRA